MQASYMMRDLWKLQFTLSSVTDELAAWFLFEAHCLSNSEWLSTSLSLFEHNFLSLLRDERSAHYTGLSSLVLCCTSYFQLIADQMKEGTNHTTVANKLTPVQLKPIQVYLRTLSIIAVPKYHLSDCTVPSSVVCKSLTQFFKTFAL